MEDRMRRLEDALLQSNGITNILPSNIATLDVPMSEATSLINSNSITGTPNISDRPGKVTLNLSCSLGAFPAASITDIAFTDNTSDPSFRPDLISCNVISLTSANEYFVFYREHLDHHMHYLFSDNDTLATVRARSSLLTAAICTVASFCSGSRDYQNCFKAFTDSVSRKLFADKYDFDDVRALAVGALWLNDISSALNGMGEWFCIISEPNLSRPLNSDALDSRSYWYTTRSSSLYHEDAVYEERMPRSDAFIFSGLPLRPSLFAHLRSTAHDH